MPFSKITALGVTLLAASAAATTVRQAGLRELVAHSELAVVAVPVKHESFWDGGRIVTRVTLAVSETWVGRTQQTVEVYTPGGVIGDIGQHVDGVPSLPLRQPIAVLLRRDGRARLAPVGLWQGVFHIELSGADPTVRRSEQGASVGAAAVMPGRLSELRRAVREAQHAR